MMPQGWPFGAYPPGGLERLGPHVTAYYAHSFPISNSAIVRGADATLVFDANTLRYARGLRVALDAEPSPPLRDVLLSHHHDDHTFGTSYFSPPARVLARAYVRERLRMWTTWDRNAFAEAFRAYYPGADADLEDARIVVPDELIEEPTMIELGGDVVVHVHPEPKAHTKGDLWAMVAPDGVALCGDLWFSGCEPYFGHGSIEGAVSAVDRLRDAEASVYLPGHGPAGRIERAEREPLQRYGIWLRERVREGMSRGLAGDELKAEVRLRYREREPFFAYAVPGFLEDAVEAEERTAREG